MNEKRFRELKKKYAYDIALMNQRGGSSDKEELYELLLVAELSSGVADLLNDFLIGCPKYATVAAALCNISEALGKVCQQLPTDISDLAFSRVVSNLHNGFKELE